MPSEVLCSLEVSWWELELVPADTGKVVGSGGTSIQWI